MTGWHAQARKVQDVGIKCRRLGPRLWLEPLEPRRMLASVEVPNIQITSDLDVQQQPSVAADPHASGHVAIAYLDRSLVPTGYAGIRISISHDGGATWSQSSIPLPANYDQAAGQPIAEFDDHGRLFVSFMAGTFLGHKPPINDPSGIDPDTGQRFRADGFTSNNALFVARSDDGGLTWNSPVPVVTHLYDGVTPVPYDIMPDMAIDTNPSSPNYGNIYVLWIRFYPAGQYPGEPTSTGGSHIQIAVSSDGASSFQLRPTIRDTNNSGIGKLAGQGVANWPRIAVGPEGNVYVDWYDFGNYFVIHSTDGAKTFDSIEKSAEGEHALFSTDGSAADPIAGANLLRFYGFRTGTPSRTIVADPTRPGTVYAADFIATFDSLGNEIDSDILFARSKDSSLTWSQLQRNGKPAAVNDDNLGVPIKLDNPNDVGARQFITRMAVDADGTIVLVWYDTRRDARANEHLDVFGAISTDGGKSFGPNFRITQKPFSVEDGKFIDARGDEDYYLGDFLGLSVVNGTAYVAWTDTRTGNQDVFFSKFSTKNPPTPDNDRYEPNDAPVAATDLGVVLQRVVPKLHMGSGDADVFTFRTRATGTLTVTATQALAGKRLNLQLLDSSGATVLATSQSVLDASGKIIGERVSFPSQSGGQYMLRVGSAGGATGYSLDIQALTADLGAIAYDVTAGTMTVGDQNYFRFTSAASGTIQLTLTPDSGVSGDIVLEILDPHTLDPVSTASPLNVASLVVSKGQTLFARVSSPTVSGGSGAYSLQLVNLDAFATADPAALLFPAGEGPSQLAMGDVNNDGHIDAVVSTAGLSNTISVLLSNGDGTFQAPRQFPVGVFRPSALGPIIPTFRRDLVLGDFNRDGNLDVATTNLNSADISVLLGRGDGTFQPQRRFDATTLPFGLATGDLNNDGILDLAVIDTSVDVIQLAVLLGRGDGTFRRQVFIPTNLHGAAGNPAPAVLIADVNKDGNADLIYTGALDATTYVRLGKGDGITFAQPLASKGGGPGLALADLNGDGKLDLVNCNYFTNEVSYSLGLGNGRFGAQTIFFGGQSPVAVAVADVASLNPSGTLGPADGVPDILTVGTGAPQATVQGPPQIMVSPGTRNSGGVTTYGDGVHLAGGTSPLDLALSDLDGNGSLEIAFVDIDGVRLIFDAPPDIPANSTRQSARDLGTVVHLLQPTLTIVPGHADAWYRLTVPTEATSTLAEVLDFSANFEHEQGAGLQMQVLDASGKLLGGGAHVRIAAAQGQTLYVHILSNSADAAGAYTLDIATLPQLVSARGQALLPGINGFTGGPTSSLVLTFQGDRLDQTVAEDPGNYLITWLGPDGLAGTADDRRIPIEIGEAQAVVYNPGANVDVSTGLAYPTAVHQTVTLLFKDPLPAGSYRIQVSKNVVTAAFNEAEGGVDPHPVVTFTKSGIADGGDVSIKKAVLPTGE
ncbi:MAG TPA: FG-GAP-like repeat-containing protein, partial [Tepidisphaeraceae bacterium]